MKLEHVKVGRRAAYRAKASQGRGTIVKVYKRKTGHWVTLQDRNRPQNGGKVTVRLSQVKPV